MKFFLMHDPKFYAKCARFSHVGTWTSGKLCNKCEQPSSYLVEPLQIEWEPDSDFICDFSWCGYTPVLKETVAIHLQKNGFEFNFGNVTHCKATTKSKKKLVPFPYVGSKLVWLMPFEKIPINERNSGVQLIISCDECGQNKYSFKTEGLIIDMKNWSGQHIFHIKQFSRSRAIFVTEEAVAILKNLEIGNITFSEAGIIK